jgi:hypothetical protein
MSETIERTLGEIVTKCDMLLEFHREGQKADAKMDDRVKHLEKWQARVIGAYAALVVIVTAYLKLAH